MSVRIESQAEPIPGYKLLDRLGSGGFGEVWKCEAPGGINKAVKVIFGDLRSQDNDLIRYAEQELKALKRVKQVRHPYLLALDRYDIVDGLQCQQRIESRRGEHRRRFGTRRRGSFGVRGEDAAGSAP